MKFFSGIIQPGGCDNRCVAGENTSRIRTRDSASLKVQRMERLTPRESHGTLLDVGCVGVFSSAKERV